MKKFLLTMFMAVTTIVAMAQTKTYTGNLVVTTSGSSTEPQETTIFVEQDTDGIYTLQLNKFALGEGEEALLVGNIVVDNITVTEANGIKSFATERNIFITAGDDENYWLGPDLGKVPVSLTGKMGAGGLYCTIDIDMIESLGQVINVVFSDKNYFIASKTTYTDNLTISIDGDPTELPETTIIVEQYKDNTYSLLLNNFTLGEGEEALLVGNIVVDNITVTEANGIKSFATERNIFITAGDDENYWLGPDLGKVPVSLTGKMGAGGLYCTIDIDMIESLGQVINVVFSDKNYFIASKTTYTDNLTISIDGDPTELPETTIIVEQYKDNTYSLLLNNFTLGEGEEALLVGNIVLNNITATEANRIKNIDKTERNIFITAGDSENEWYGPALGKVLVSLTGKMDAEKLYCTIDIDMSEMLGQIINVVFGDEKAVTSIENVTVENGKNVIYDITGRKVKEITNAGIYIVNGKKVFVK